MLNLISELKSRLYDIFITKEIEALTKDISRYIYTNSLLVTELEAERKRNTELLTKLCGKQTIENSLVNRIKELQKETENRRVTDQSGFIIDPSLPKPNPLKQKQVKDNYQVEISPSEKQIIVRFDSTDDMWKSYQDLFC